MHAKIHTIAFRGIETIAVTVQIHIANGLPAMAIEGAIQPVSGVLPAAIAAVVAGHDLICPHGLKACQTIPRLA